MSIKPPESAKAPELRSFFERLGARQDSSPEAGVVSFHDQFFSLDPHAVNLVTREQLAAALPMRAAMFKSIGAAGTRLTDLSEIWLDDRHVLASTEWDVVFASAEAEPLTLSASYLLRRTDDDWEILVYLNHQDIRRVIGARAVIGAAVTPPLGQDLTRGSAV